MIGRLYRQTAKQFGIQPNIKFYTETKKENTGEEIFTPEERILGENYPQCGVPNCNKKGVFYDPKFKVLCENCYKFVKKRKEKGEDPYQDIEKDRQKDTKNIRKTRLMKHNSYFWEMIKKSSDQSTWQQLWRWGKGTQHEIGQETLEEVRRIIIANLKNLTFGQLNYRMKIKNKKIVFLHLECWKCGEVHEIDVYQILQNKESFSYLCPCCSGIYSSQRLFRWQKLIKRLTKGDLNYKGAIQETGYSYEVLATLVSTYKKGGIKGLAQRIGFPYFGIPAKNNDLDLLKKTEKHLQSSLHPDNFI